MDFIKVSESDAIKKTVEFTFRDDVEISKFSEYTCENAASSIFDKIVEVNTMHDGEFFALINEDVIGYINLVRSKNLLHSFGLNIKCRTEENKKGLIEVLNVLLPKGDIVCALFLNNERGIKYLEKYGNFNREPIITLIKKK